MVERVTNIAALCIRQSDVRRKRLVLRGLLQLQLRVVRPRTRLSLNQFYPSNQVSTTEGIAYVSRVIHWTYVQDMALCLRNSKLTNKLMRCNLPYYI